MATLYITEYARLASDGSGVPVIVGLEPASTQTVSIGGSSAQSTALKPATRFVRLHTDAICNVRFGTDPTAVTNADARLAANQTEFFGVSPGLSIAVISGS